MIGILAFEGPDKVGKSTVIRALNQKTGYRFLCIDRFLGSAWVYDRLSGRRNREAEIQEAEIELGGLACSQVVNVMLTCDRDILAERISREDEYASERLRVLDKMIGLYTQYASATQMRTIVVDTSNATIDDTVQEILQKIGEPNA